LFTDRRNLISQRGRRESPRCVSLPLNLNGGNSSPVQAYRPENSFRTMRGLPYKPKVFISHSTKVEEPQAVRFLSHLHETLVQATNTAGTAAFEVLLDQKSLPIGETWRDEIDEWVDCCDAAIVVLSEAATQSDNVK